MFFSHVCPFKVHITSSSPVATHCVNFALSSPGAPEFTQPCDHQHTARCDRCEAGTLCLTQIETALREADLEPAVREDLQWQFEKAAEDINALKCHLIR